MASAAERTAATRRQRAYQKRLAAGRASLPLEVTINPLVEAMIDQGLLDEGESEDRRAIAAVAEMILEDWQKLVTRQGTSARKSGSITE